AVLPPESDDRIKVLRECLEVTPLHEAAHIELVRTLVRRGLRAEAEHQIEASLAYFQSERVDTPALTAAFADARRPPSCSARPFSADVAPLEAAVGRQEVPAYGPTLLVMPFTPAAPDCVLDADSVTSDIIFGIAKLRSIGVIAQGTAFSLRSQLPAAA